MRQQEHIEAVRFMRWVDGFRGTPGAILKWPCLKWLHHIPNGGLRNRVVAGKLKAEGVRAGVSDYFLPWPMLVEARICSCGNVTWPSAGNFAFCKCWSSGDVIKLDYPKYHGLYIELKAQGVTRTSPSQDDFIADMKAAGYGVALASGCSEAVDIVTAYLEGTWENAD